MVNVDKISYRIEIMIITQMELSIPLFYMLYKERDKIHDTRKDI